MDKIFLDNNEALHCWTVIYVIFKVKGIFDPTITTTFKEKKS
jgi:hypothetical protein